MKVYEETIKRLLETMEEGKNFRVSRYDRLAEGKRLSMEHDISCEDMDLSALAELDQETVDEMSRISGAMEQKTLLELKEAFRKWECQAAVTQAIHRVREYQKTPEIPHTANRWEKNPKDHGMEEISNRVYWMYDRVYEHKKWNAQTKQSEPVAWDVTWAVYVRSPKEAYLVEKIAGQENKKYTEKAAAMKYLEGRKNAYAHLFTEISPPVPEEYAKLFQVNGMLLPGYRMEGQEPERKEEQTERPAEQEILPERGRRRRGR